jgi:hypothetical protein
MKTRKVQNDVQTQVEELVKLTHGWKPMALKGEIKEKQALFDAACVQGDRCMDTSVGSALVSISSVFEKLSLTFAFQHHDEGAYAESLKGFVAFKYLHYRLLRIVFKTKRNEDLYGLMLEEFGLAACAAIYCGFSKEANWLGKEFVRHMKQDYECPYSVDAEFLNVCLRIIERYLGIRDTFDTRDGAIGRYSDLLEAVEKGSIESAYKLLDERTKGAYRRLVLDEEPQDFYGSIFSALFPFEVLAFLKLAGNGDFLSDGIRHPLLACFDGLPFERADIEHDFTRTVEQRLSELETQRGLEAVI